MELAIASGLAGLGYLMSQNNNNNRKENENITSLSENNRPNTNDPTSNDMVKKAKSRLKRESEKRWKKSRTPKETKIIPANYNINIENGEFIAPNSNDNSLNEYAKNYQQNTTFDNEFQQSFDNEVNNNNNNNNVEGFNSNHNSEFIASAADPSINSVNPNNTHNNMVPFFGGSIKQNTRIDQHQTTLDLFTGSEFMKPPKKEVEAMFVPEKDVNNVNGLKESFNSDRERYIQSNYQNGIKPFQPVRVGRGMNQGVTSAPSGGFHDTYRPPVKSVDELRVNKKVTYEGRLNPVKSAVTNRGKNGEVFKNRPEKFYHKGEDHLFKGPGAYTKEKRRGKILLKDQNRKVFKTIQGGAEPAGVKKQETRPEVQKDRKVHLCGPGKRNLAASGKWTTKKGEVDPSDYGKSGHKSYPNERQVTEKRVVRNNLKPEVEKPTVHLEDKPKVTRKQNYTTYSRKGNAKLRGTQEHTLPLTQKTRTTLKETLIHDDRTGEMVPQRPSKIQTHDPDSKARTTIRETTENFNVRSNLKAKGTQSHQSYYTDTARTTIKETAIHDTRTGNVNTSEKKSSAQSYNPEEWKAKTTMRQVFPNNKYGCCVEPKPQLSGNQKHTLQHTQEAKTTMKETTIESQRDGNLTGKAGAGSSKHTLHHIQDAKTTMKETTIEQQRIGNANQGVLQSGKGYITANKSANAPNTNRQFTSDYEYTGITGGVETNENGYKVAPANAPDTNRQFTSDYEYKGTGNSYMKAQMSYHDKYNAKLNALKEVVAKGRNPTNSNVKLMSGGDMVQLEGRKKVAVEEKCHQPGLQRIYSNTTGETSFNCQQTKVPNKDDTANIAERVEPELLNAFNENPYTQPLNSV